MAKIKRQLGISENTKRERAKAKLQLGIVTFALDLISYTLVVCREKKEKAEVSLSAVVLLIMKHCSFIFHATQKCNCSIHPCTLSLHVELFLCFSVVCFLSSCLKVS